MVSRLKQWLPQHTIEQVAASDYETLLKEHGDVPFLLVHLDSLESDLAAGLMAISGQAARSDDLAFATVVGDTRQLMRMMNERKQAARRRSSDGNADRVTDAMLEDAYFVCKVDKRSPDNDDFVRVSVGRARNHDIVLRHDSVSKFHAWLDRDPGGKVFVRDASSKNRTLINGEPTKRERTEVKPGDRITFGSVETVLCSPGALWDALVSQ